MALGGVAAVATADRQMLAATALLVILGGTGNNLTSTLAATARHGQITVFYPLLMIGGAGGAAWATHIIQTGRPLVHIQALIALQLAEPALIRPYQQAIRSRPALGRIATSAGRAAALATCAYGPLTAYAILVTVSVGAQHVGASMAAYAAGAASAASADRLLRRNPRYAADGWAGTVALAAAGVATWAAATTIPGLLAGRAASGLLMFLAQGRLLRRSHTEGGEAQVAGASAGLGLGGGLGGLLAARAAQDVGTPIAGVLFAAATLTLIPLGRILAGRTKTRQGDAASDTEEPAAGQERT